MRNQVEKIGFEKPGHLEFGGNTVRLAVKSLCGTKIHYILNRAHYLCKKLTPRAINTQFLY
jgi:hypothetical protein